MREGRDHRRSVWDCPGSNAQGPHRMRTANPAKMGAVSDTRVLVVDDEANITDLVATALRYEGFDVEVASTGTDALRAAETFRPDLMVLDIMLPDRDGFAVVQRLRRRPPRARRVPHRARLHRREGEGPHGRRRRLRDEAVQPRRARRRVRGVAAHRRDQRRHLGPARVRRPRARRRHARGVARPHASS